MSTKMPIQHRFMLLLMVAICSSGCADELEIIEPAPFVDGGSLQPPGPSTGQMHQVDQGFQAPHDGAHPPPTTSDAGLYADAEPPPTTDSAVGPDDREPPAPPDAWAPDPESDASVAPLPDAQLPPLEPCGFDYARDFDMDELDFDAPSPGGAELRSVDSAVRAVAHAEPPPPYTWSLATGRHKSGDDDLVMPGYDDRMPPFARGREWVEPVRCYETPNGTERLTEAQAYDMYRQIAEHTTGLTVSQARERRSVIGLRGAYPGTMSWHGNVPNRFNDTIVLVWRDAAGAPHVREFPVNTDVGSHDFGRDSSSSLRPNVRYHMINGWHRGYNALSNARSGYRVRDDHNNNGHWDSDRNGWLPPLDAPDYDRGGSAHNIHMGALEPPLGRARIDQWSAGCQVIPGLDNWIEFITNAWTGLGDTVDYFLVDVRDIPASVWRPCPPDGSHACPWPVDSLPFEARGDTTRAVADEFDAYSCNPDANESGREDTYVLTLDRSGTLRARVDCNGPVDVDVHLLDGDDPNACLARAHIDFEHDISPGRYLIVVDTYVDNGRPLSGPYTLTVELD